MTNTKYNGPNEKNKNNFQVQEGHEAQSPQIAGPLELLKVSYGKFGLGTGSNKSRYN